MIIQIDSNERKKNLPFFYHVKKIEILFYLFFLYL